MLGTNEWWERCCQLSKRARGCLVDSQVKKRKERGRPQGEALSGEQVKERKQAGAKKVNVKVNVITLKVYAATISSFIYSLRS
jgi:hypothetical protein